MSEINQTQAYLLPTSGSFLKYSLMKKWRPLKSRRIIFSHSCFFVPFVDNHLPHIGCSRRHD
jgi:hypothetical protein